MLARDLGFLSATTYDGTNAELIEVKRMLTALLQRIQRGMGRPTRNEGIFASANTLNSSGLAES